MWLDENNLVNFDFDKVVSASFELLTEVTDIQNIGSMDRAEAHFSKYFEWNDIMQQIADTIRKHSPYLIRIVDEPLKDYLLSEQAIIDINNEITTPRSMETIGGR